MAGCLLDVRDLWVRSGEMSILRGVDLRINAGEVHLLLGRNGSGKSTLAHTLVGRSMYEVEKGEVFFGGVCMTGASPEERSHAGLFMAFQQPTAISGVSNMHFLQAVVNAQRKARGLDRLKAGAFLPMVRGAMAQTGWDSSFLGRSVHEDFSGGEKKRGELLQLVLLSPRLAILDETDSGLDQQGRGLLVKIIEQQQRKGCAFLIITHYDDLMQALSVDEVHHMQDGVLRSGDVVVDGVSVKGAQPTASR